MTEQKTVLLVEDNAKLNESNRRALELKDYRVLTALTLREAREHLKACDPDVILLDVMLPDGDGIDFCGEIHNSVTSHILFLTAKTEQENRIRGLAYGGDDYITKPFKLEELLARVGAAMRRREKTPKPEDKISAGDLTLNTISQRALWRGADINLLTKEFAILKFLMQRNGRYFLAEDLYRELWGMEAFDIRAVKQNIYRIRKSFTENSVGYSIEQRRGLGYRFIEGAGVEDNE
jgi:DNA-binding response OmpR family regulator